MTSKTLRCYNVSIWSENRRRKHDVVTTLDFGRSNYVGKTTLWQRYFDFVRRRDKKTTKNQIVTTWCASWVKVVLFVLSHWTKFGRSKLIFLLMSMSELLAYNRFVLPASWCIFEFFIDRCKSFLYMTLPTHFCIWLYLVGIYLLKETL